MIGTPTCVRDTAYKRSIKNEGLFVNIWLWGPVGNRDPVYIRDPASIRSFTGTASIWLAELVEAPEDQGSTPDAKRLPSWDQYNNGFNHTYQTGYSTCKLDLPLHHPAPWCVIYPRVPSLVPYFSFCTVATCSWSLISHGLCLHLYADDSQIYSSCRPSA